MEVSVPAVAPTGQRKKGGSRAGQPAVITEKRTSDKDGKETRVVFSLQLRLANEERRGKGAAGKDEGGRSWC